MLIPPFREFQERKHDPTKTTQINLHLGINRPPPPAKDVAAAWDFYFQGRGPPPHPRLANPSWPPSPLLRQQLHRFTKRSPRQKQQHKSPPHPPSSPARSFLLKIQSPPPYPRPVKPPPFWPHTLQIPPPATDKDSGIAGNQGKQ